MSVGEDEEMLLFCRQLEEELKEIQQEKKPESRAQATRRRCAAGVCCVFNVDYSRQFKFGDHVHCGHKCIHECGDPCKVLFAVGAFRPGKQLIQYQGFASRKRRLRKSS